MGMRMGKMTLQIQSCREDKATCHAWTTSLQMDKVESRVPWTRGADVHQLYSKYRMITYKSGTFPWTNCSYVLISMVTCLR